MAGFDLNSIRDSLNEWAAEAFKLGPNNTIGVDVGTSAVKVAEVINHKKGSYKINKFAYKQLPEGTIIEDDIVKPEEIVAAINACFEELDLKNKNISIGIFGPNTMSKRLQVSTGNRQEIEDQVMWESEQYIPFGIDDSTVSFHIIGENEGGGTDVFVAAAANKVIENYQKIAQECNLKLKIIDLNYFALSNAFEIAYRELINTDMESILIIDLGTQSTNLVIYKNKNIIFTRELSIGGGLVTEEIQRQMNMNYEEAENIKCNGDGSGNLPEEIVESVNISIESIITEVKKTLNFYLTASSEESISRCFITGGNSLLVGMFEQLERELGLPIERVELMNSMEVNSSNINDELGAYINACGAIAVGLALRKIFK